MNPARDDGTRLGRIHLEFQIAGSSDTVPGRFRGACPNSSEIAPSGLDRQGSRGVLEAEEAAALVAGRGAFPPGRIPGILPVPIGSYRVSVEGHAITRLLILL